MKKQQLQEDIAQSQVDVVEENPTAEQIAQADNAWNDTLNSPESLDFLDSLIEKGLKEMDENK